ncbi:TIGR02391 family protein [Antrihabitans spumae]|uniref:TIGR02391 family protein n=1 Tax=Antrihabitans spumae TaxID=3373370 RepID=A0ABW7KCI1_9NOCA
MLSNMQLDGVDIEWVDRALRSFVAETEPVNQSSSGAGYVSITPQMAPKRGRLEALRLTEVIRPILDKLYPEWRSENSTNEYDEFKSERDAASRLIARLSSHVEVEKRLGGLDSSPKISAAALHPLIWQAASAQWSTGHRHEAVLAAAKAVNSHLQTKIGRRDVSETDLVKQAFSDKAPEPGKPRLRFSAVVDEKTRESLRRGVLEFGSGCFAAIRNPIGHLPNAEVDLNEQTALERLAALSLLARWIDDATLVST